MTTIDNVLRAHDGVAPRSAFIAAGLTSWQLGRARHSGLLRHVRRAWYAASDADPRLIAAVRVGGALSCISALERAGVWVRRDSAIHIAVPANAARLRSAVSATVRFVDDPANVALHWRREPGAVTQPLTSLAESLLHTAACQTPELALVAIDCALNRRLVTLDELKPLFTTVGSRALLDMADPGSQSGLETLARFRLRRHRIRLRTQVLIAGVGRIDVLIGDRLVLELDGYAFHATGEFFETDRQRDLALASLGYRVLRLSYRQVMYDWPTAELAVLTMVRRGDHLWPRSRSTPFSGGEPR